MSQGALSPFSRCFDLMGKPARHVGSRGTPGSYDGHHAAGCGSERALSQRASTCNRFSPIWTVEESVLQENQYALQIWDL